MKTLEELKNEFFVKFTKSDSNIPDGGNDEWNIWQNMQSPDEVWQFLEEAIKEEREETKTIEEWEEDFWDIMRNDFGVVDFSGTQARAYELKQFISELIKEERENVKRDFIGFVDSLPDCGDVCSTQGGCFGCLYKDSFARFFRDNGYLNS